MNDSNEFPKLYIWRLVLAFAFQRHIVFYQLYYNILLVGSAINTGK